MNDEQIFLANAYLDGELTAEERRIAEADPEVMTEVDQLGALRAELRDVTPPSSAAREAAITAAMGEFVTKQPVARAAAPAPVVPFRPRPAYARMLAVAAAVVAVAGLGIVVAQNGLGGGGDDDSIASDEPVAELSARETADATAESTVEEADAGAVAEDGSGATIAAGAADDEPASAEVAADAADEGTTEMAEAAEATSAPQPVVVPPDFDPEAPISDADELGEYGAYLLDQRDRNQLGATPNTPCGGDYEILGQASFLFDDVATSVYVAIQERDGFVLALDTDDCVELVRASLFTD